MPHTPGRDFFHDPAGRLADYNWEINHLEESGEDLAMSIQRSAVTTGVSYVRQQGTPSPLILTYTGTILTESQLLFMRAYTNACMGIGTPPRSINFTDFNGAVFEVLITDFNPIKKAAARNPRDPQMPYHFYTYSITMEVINQL